MKSVNACMALLAVTLCVSSAWGQEPGEGTVIDPPQISVQWQESFISDQAANSWLVPYYRMGQFGFPAEDGHYLAQTQEELQTYYDLSMSYKYIESPQIRALLQLDDGEGIMIESVEPDGLGEQAGFLAGDLVLRVDDTPVQTQYELVIALTERRGTDCESRVRRKSDVVQLKMKLDHVFVANPSRWIIGVNVEEMSELLRLHLGLNGTVITSVTEGGPAEKMGLRENDIILEINDNTVENGEQLRVAVQTSGGEKLTIGFIRAGNKMTVELKPVELEITSTRASQIVNFVPLERYALFNNLAVDNLAVRVSGLDEPASDVSTQDRLDKISSQLELLQQQVDALRQSIEK